MAKICLSVLTALLMSAGPSVTGSRILLVSQQLKSHIHEQLVLGQQLVAMGNEVYTVLGEGVPLEDMAQSYGIKVLRFHVPAGTELLASREFDGRVWEGVFSGTYFTHTALLTSSMVLRDCTLILQDVSLMQQIQRLGFDMAITDSIQLSPCTMLVPASLNIPFIAMSSMLMPTWAGVPALPSFCPDILALHPDTMTFGQRLVNIIPYVMTSNVWTHGLLFDLPGVTDTALLQKYAPMYKDLIHLYKKAELYIVSRDHSLEWPTPSMPHTLYLPGITPAPAKPLDETLTQIVDTAQHGLLIVSFGSLSVPLPDDIVRKFMEAFKQVELTVIWKYPDISQHLRTLVPTNVHLLRWMPQNDLLGHPNTRLFITHCGNNGQHEALYHGVPMIGFPMFADQYHNAFRMQARGLGVTMDILDFTTQSLLANIHSVLASPEVLTNISRYSKMLKSRPMLPKEEAAYWVDHVIQFGSAHFRSSSIDMPLHQLYLLDILLLAVVFVIFIAALMCGLFVYSYKRCYQIKTLSGTKIKQN